MKKNTPAWMTDTVKDKQSLYWSFTLRNAYFWSDFDWSFLSAAVAPTRVLWRWIYQLRTFKQNGEDFRLTQ